MTEIVHCETCGVQIHPRCTNCILSHAEHNQRGKRRDQARTLARAIAALAEAVAYLYEFDEANNKPSLYKKPERFEQLMIALEDGAASDDVEGALVIEEDR